MKKKDKIKEKCENCKYYSEKEDSSLGECRKYVPKVFVWEEDKRIESYSGGRENQRISGTKTCFPKVYKNEWCGEFSPKKVKS